MHAPNTKPIGNVCLTSPRVVTTIFIQKSAKGAGKWSSPVCQSMCATIEYKSLSLTKEHWSKCNISKALDISGYVWIGFVVYMSNMSALI